MTDDRLRALCTNPGMVQQALEADAAHPTHPLHELRAVIKRSPTRVIRMQAAVIVELWATIRVAEQILEGIRDQVQKLRKAQEGT